MLEASEVQKIREIVASVLELDAADVTDHANFITDLGTDSLRVIEILTRVEQEFATTIDQSYLARMVSLDAVCRILAECRLETA